MIQQLGRYLVALGVLLLALLSTPCSAATIFLGPAVKLQTLMAGGTVVAGDKTFSNFTFLSTGDMPNPDGSTVNVVPIQDDAGNFGIRFQGAFIDATGSLGGSDALITYKVTADLVHLISDAHIEGNPTLLGNTGSMSVTDTFLPLSQVPPYRMKIYDDQNLGVKLVDSTSFTPIQSLNVQKDILGLAKLDPQSPEIPQTVTLSFVDQTYSQITIPEPAMVLLVFGSIVAFGCGWRRRATST